MKEETVPTQSLHKANQTLVTTSSHMSPTAFTYLLPGLTSGLVSRAQSCRSLKGQYPASTQQSQVTRCKSRDAGSSAIQSPYEQLQHVTYSSGHKFISDYRLYNKTFV